ncbi:hypothetical protein AgCh_022559 [Apium graveolens]
MATEFTGLMKDISGHLEMIAKSMYATQEREIEVVEQKKKLLNEIASLLGITQAEAIRAASLFSSNPNQMYIFFLSPNMQQVLIISPDSKNFVDHVWLNFPVSNELNKDGLFQVSFK